MIHQNKISLLCLAAAVLLAASKPHAAEPEVEELRFEPLDQTRNRTVPVKIYLCPSRGPQPVILFSHGLGGSRENNEYLGKNWAAAGFVAVFMQHAGSDNEVWKQAASGDRLAALKSAASAISSRQRFHDVPFVIDQLEIWNNQAEHPLQRKLDLNHIGMSGHSFGAVTTLAVAGRKYPLNRSFAEERIDAFLAMSPQPGKGIETNKAFGHIVKPVLCMTGTRDASPIDASLKPETRQEVFTALPAGSKYQLVLDGAEHSAFGDSRRLGRRRRNPAHHPAIQQISVQFWKAYLKNDSEAKRWLQSESPVKQTGLSGRDKWDWK